MKFPYARTLAATLAVALLTLGLSTVPASAAVTVQINGQTANFTPAPLERAGRVFVPLRGVFERLGASVVYANRVINATGNGRNISLTIGSNVATVNGAQQTLDVAPFIIGAYTFVPLRFVSQALGATVNYDNGNRVVAISMSGGGAPAPQYTSAPAPSKTPFNTVALENVRPANGGVTEAKRPEVSARFSESVDPNSVHISLDDRDVSNTSYVSTRDFRFAPSYDLPAEKHTVRVTGKSSAGVGFDRSFSFTSGVSAQSNFLNDITPAAGTNVGGGAFTLKGKTLPGSKVRVIAQGGANLGGIFRINTGTFTAETTADASTGAFSQQISTNAPGGGDIGVRIISTAPSGAAVTKDVQYRT